MGRNVDKSINIDTRVLTDPVGVIIANILIGASTPENNFLARPCTYQAIMLTCVGSGYENNRKNCLELYMLYCFHMCSTRDAMGSLINNFIKVWEQGVFDNHD